MCETKLFKNIHSQSIVLLLLLFFTNQSDAQGPSARYGHTMTVVNDTIYLFGGTDVPPTTAKLFASLHTQDKSSKPTVGVFNDLWRWDENHTVWVEEEPSGPPPPARSHHTANSMGEMMYVIGGVGENDNVLDDIWSFNTKTDTWTKLLSSGTERYDHQSAVLGDKIVVFGGMDASGNDVKTVGVYDPVSDSWSQVLEHTYGRSNATETSWDNKLHMWGGQTDGWATNAYLIYNPSANQMVDVEPNGYPPSSRFGHASAKTRDDKWIQFGGRRWDGATLNGVWQYDLVSKVWNKLPPLPSRLLYPAAALLSGNGTSKVNEGSGRILIFGGLRDGTPQAETFIYDLEMDELSRIEITPTDAVLSIGDDQEFEALVYDEDGHVTLATVEWSTDGGGTLSPGGSINAISYTANEAGYWKVIAQLIVQPSNDEEEIYKAMADTTLSDTVYVQVTPSTGVANMDIIPREFQLWQNCPNPFNPETTIRFEVKQPAHVDLKVYDLQGRKVATLVDKEYNRGCYDITFDAGQLNSGIYLYRIQIGDFCQTRKMVIAK